MAELTGACTGGHTGPSDLSLPFSACDTPVWWCEQAGAGIAAEQTHREKASLRTFHSELEKLFSCAIYHRIIFSVVCKL